MKTVISAISTATLIALAGCGGGGSTATSTTAALTASYPAGVSGSSPTSVVTASSTTITAAASIPPNQKFGYWLNTLIASIKNQDGAQFMRVMQAALPLGNAIAAPTKVPEGKLVSAYISEVASGTKVPTVANLGFDSFFASYLKATCFGPSVSYENHDDFVAGIPAANGNLPGGDLGIWLARAGDQTTGKPCSAAQLDSLIEPIKKRTNASMILSARMRALAIAAGGLPASGTSVDVTSAMDTLYQTLLPATPVAITGSVTSATVSNAAGIYTYSFVAEAAGGGKNKKIVVQMTHDGTATNFTGNLTYATTGGYSCTQVLGAAAGVKTNVGTIRYSKISDTETQVSARSSNICVAGTRDNVTSTFSDYVALTSNNEIDPAVIESANVKGWTQEGSGFNRFAATYDPATLVGNFKFAWQAGTGDNKSRMFAMSVTRDGTTEELSAKAFFGFSGAMTDTSAGATDMKGMICNWAGPGNNHTPGDKFQYQSLKLAASSTEWDFATGAGSNKITYAPTVSCSSTGTMKFDVDASGALGATEGNSVSDDLDVVDIGKTVQETLVLRGFSDPALY